MFLDQLAQQQIVSDPFYDEGLFPSQMIWKLGNHPAQDDNIFYNVAILYTLKSLLKTFNEEELGTAESILKNGLKNIEKYRNRNNEITYNYYQTHPEKPFPGLTIFSKWEMAKLPDDLDSTVLKWLVKHHPEGKPEELKKLMEQETFKFPVLNSSYPEYNNSMAYRTWFSDKMSQDVDVSVNCNILLFVLKNNLPLSEIDRAAIEFVKQVIKDKRHLKNGHLISAFYQKPAIIIYHIARVISDTNLSDFDELKPQLIEEIKEELNKVKNDIEKVILYICWIKLGGSPEFEFDLKKVNRDIKKFYWFRTNFLCGWPFIYKRLFGHWRILNYNNLSIPYSTIHLLELKQLGKGKIIQKGENKVFTNKKG